MCSCILSIVGDICVMICTTIMFYHVGLGIAHLCVQEARALGIPDYALPHLSSDPTLEEARAAQQKIESIVASFMSADI